MNGEKFVKTLLEQAEGRPEEQNIKSFLVGAYIRHIMEMTDAEFNEMCKKLDKENAFTLERQRTLDWYRRLQERLGD
jgi:hypothetical protein